MLNVLLVGVGGFLGSIARYGVGMALGGHGTLVVNIAGCFVIGLLAGRGGFSTPARAFLFSGVLGGFTTFSAFGFETFQLLRAGQWPTAALSLATQLVLGVGGVWAGYALAAR